LSVVTATASTSPGDAMRATGSSGAGGAARAKVERVIVVSSTVAAKT
jgi:hypothetical protein